MKLVNQNMLNLIVQPLRQRRGHFVIAQCLNCGECDMRVIDGAGALKDEEKVRLQHRQQGGNEHDQVPRVATSSDDRQMPDFNQFLQ